MTQIDFSFTRFLDFLADTQDDHTLNLKNDFTLYSREGSFTLESVELEEDNNGTPAPSQIKFSRGEDLVFCEHASYLSGRQWEIRSVAHATPCTQGKDLTYKAEQILIDFFYAIGLNYNADQVETRNANDTFAVLSAPILESVPALLRGKLRCR